jgi:hypothetical protein
MFNLGKRKTPPTVTVAPYIPMLRENNVRKGFVEQADYAKLTASTARQPRPDAARVFESRC